MFQGKQKFGTGKYISMHLLLTGGHPHKISCTCFLNSWPKCLAGQLILLSTRWARFKVVRSYEINTCREDKFKFLIHFLDFLSIGFQDPTTLYDFHYYQYVNKRNFYFNYRKIHKIQIQRVVFITENWYQAFRFPSVKRRFI